MPPPRSLSEADWFWDKVDRSDDCWIWNGALGAHGYGRVIMNQVAYPAHKVAWFLVHGGWPGDRLYRTGPCGEWGKRADSVYRRCVKPDHYRDGSGRTRWNVQAHNGFPPEFRKAKDQFISTTQAETDLMPVLLYRGNLSMGRAQAMFNFTLLVQAEEAERLGDIKAMSQAWPDAAHAVGLHAPITTTTSVEQFWGRLLDNPKVLAPHPGMKDYIESTLAVSGRRPIRLERIARYSPWARSKSRMWRRMTFDCSQCGGSYRDGEHAAHRATDIHRASLKIRVRHPRVPKPKVPNVPLTSVWPYIADAPTSEHNLILSVDGVVPKSLPEFIRQDVCQDLILAVLEGEITMDELQGEAAHFVKRVFQQYPTKYGPLSLDRPAPWNPEGRTLGETLRAPEPTPTLGEEHADVWSVIREAVESGVAA